jgi:hypothetical protein
MQAVLYFGCRDLLTETFWKALEAHNFQEWGVVAMYGDKGCLAKLQQFQKDLKPGNDMATSLLGRMIKELKLALEYPEVRQVTIQFLRPTLEDLEQVSVKERKAWVAERVATRRKQIAEKKCRTREADGASGREWIAVGLGRRGGPRRSGELEVKLG